MNRNRAQRELIIETARKQVGYRAQPERKSAFASRKEYLGMPWNGAFVQRILTTAFDAEPEVSFVSTVSALSYYIKANRLYLKAKSARPGDVVFFNFATDPQHMFEQPHVGFVTEIRADGSIRTIEGETSPGTPQGSQLADGVFERVRWPAEVIGFVRPEPRKPIPAASAEPRNLKLSYFESNGKTVARAVETVQIALNRINPKQTFRESKRGKRDGEFKATLGAYGRERGTVEARGETSARVLRALADETGFTLE